MALTCGFGRRGDLLVGAEASPVLLTCHQQLSEGKPAVASSKNIVYVAEIDTSYSVIAVAETEQDAIDLVSRKALSFLRSAKAITSSTNTAKKVADYFGVNVTRIAVGTAEFTCNE